MMFIILTLIVAVAAFNLVSTLVMSVQDKRADIAILRTLGASPSSIMGIFMVQGAMVGVIGTLAGLALGLAIAFNIDVIVPAIEQALHANFLPKDIYLISKMPSEPQSTDIVPIADFPDSFFVATIYPSWRQPREPAEALRMNDVVMDRSVLEARGLTKRFAEGKLDVTVLQEWICGSGGRDAGDCRRLGLGQEHLAAFAGRAGCAHHRQRQPDGPALHQLSPQKQGALRNRHLGFIYQFHHLLAEFSAQENVAMPLRIRRDAREDCMDRAAEMLRPWAGPAHGASPGRAVGRRASARGHCARPGHASGLRAGRRAHGQSGPRHGRYGVCADAGAGAQPWHGVRDGHP
jgi:hypothetical protein